MNAKKIQAYRGHETFWNTIRMWWKMIEHIFLWLFAIQIVIFLILFVTTTGSGVWVAGKWLWAKLISVLFSFLPFGAPSILDMSIGSAEIAVAAKYYHVGIDGGFAIPAVQYAGYFGPYAGSMLGRTVIIFLLSCGVYVFMPGAVKAFKRRDEKQSRDEYVRGAKLITPAELKREIKNDREAVSLPIGKEIKMPVSAEVKHCFVVGRPGVGKTVMLSQVLEKLIERGNKIVIYDSKGDYLSKFYNPDRDVIFNPLDVRCPGWSVFNEIKTVMDIDAVSHSLISPAYQQDPFWNDAARDVFAGLLYHLHNTGNRANSDIWKAVTAPGKDIAAWLSETPGGERGYRYIEDASSKQAMSVFAVMMQYTKSFEIMAEADGAFQMNDWLQNDKGGVIFITSYRMIRDTLKPILSLFIDLLSQKLLSLKDDYDRRVFFLLDEFPTLQRLSSLVELLTLSRSKGGSVWLGTQDIGQIEKKYGAPIRDAIVNACGNSVSFSVADPHTAEYLSRKIGDTEYREIDETLSMGVSDNRDGVSLMKRKKTEKLILPAQVMQLKDLHAYAQIAGYYLTSVELTYQKYPDLAEPIILRDDLNLEQLVKSQKEISIKVRKVLGRREFDDNDNVPDMQGGGPVAGEDDEAENRSEDDHEQEHEDEIQNC